MPNWYAVHTRSRHEFKVHHSLTGAEIESFLPCVERLQRWQDRKKLVKFALFPGYVFVRIENSPAMLLAVLKTGGVVRILGARPGEPEPIPEDQVLSLRKIVAAGVTLDPYPYLQEGQRVRVKKGPLAGVEGILVEKTGRHMLALSIDVLRQGVCLTTEASNVEPL